MHTLNGSCLLGLLVDGAQQHALLFMHVPITTHMQVQCQPQAVLYLAAVCITGQDLVTAHLVAMHWPRLSTCP